MSSATHSLLIVSIAVCVAVVGLRFLYVALTEWLTPFLAGPLYLAVGVGFVVVAITSLVWIRRMRREGWPVVLPAAACLLGVVALLVVPTPSVHPSDEEMSRAYFEQHDQYEALLTMFQEDVGLDRLGDLAGDWPENPAELVGAARLKEYRTLMDSLGVQSLERQGPQEVLFLMSTWGLAVSGSSKGYLYSPVSPSPLVTDTEDDATEPVGTTYRRIEGDWYIVYEWDT
jgi:hypothetical protein